MAPEAGRLLKSFLVVSLVSWILFEKSMAVAPQISLPLVPGHSKRILSYPCTPNAPYCPLICPGGYVEGLEGCSYCLCDPGGAAISHVDTNIFDHVLIPDNGASREEACLLAMATCQVRCQTGFVTSPKDDCTFCVCREDVLQATGMNDLPAFPVDLIHPCVPHYTACQIMCRSGYIASSLLGGCQFCACND